MRSPDLDLRGCLHALAVHRDRADVARFLSLGAALHEKEPLEREVDAHGSDADGHVAFLAQPVEIAANRLLFRELVADLLAPVGHGGLVLAGDRRDLHDEDTSACRAPCPRSRTDRGCRSPCAPRSPSGTPAAAATAGTAAESTTLRTDRDASRAACRTRRRRATASRPRPPRRCAWLNVDRVDGRTNQDVPSLHFGGLHAIDANEVVAEHRLHRRAHDARAHAEVHAIELGNEVAATAPAEIAAELLRARIHRLALRDLLEVAALRDLDVQRLRLQHRGRILLRARLRTR